MDQEPADRSPERPTSADLTPAERAARRRRLAEIFGETLPEQTSDDRAEPETGRDAQEEWLKRQVPPHHG